jgi:hypothetical protein
MPDTGTFPIEGALIDVKVLEAVLWFNETPPAIFLLESEPMDSLCPTELRIDETVASSRRIMDRVLGFRAMAPPTIKVIRMAIPTVHASRNRR